MSLLKPEDRQRRGARLQSELRGVDVLQPKTLLQESWRDFIYADVWSRPGLDRRSRFLIALAGAACEGCGAEIIDGYVRGALTTDSLTLSELREAALHLAVYAGWGKGSVLDHAVSRIAEELGWSAAEVAPICPEPWDPQQRLKEGHECFVDTMTISAPPPVTPYFEAGILGFVFGEMWSRPGLDQRARRWITLVGVADSASTIPIRSHTYAAMVSGNASVEEMHEFVLQYGIHSGWPKASVMQGAVIEMGRRVTEGLPFE